MRPSCRRRGKLGPTGLCQRYARRLSDPAHARPEGRAVRTGRAVKRRRRRTLGRIIRSARGGTHAGRPALAPSKGGRAHGRRPMFVCQNVGSKLAGARLPFVRTWRGTVTAARCLRGTMMKSRARAEGCSARPSTPARANSVRRYLRYARRHADPAPARLERGAVRTGRAVRRLRRRTLVGLFARRPRTARPPRPQSEGAQ